MAVPTTMMMREDVTPRCGRRFLYRELNKEELWEIVRRKKFIRIALSTVTVKDRTNYTITETTVPTVVRVCESEISTREKDAYCSLAEDALAVMNYRAAMGDKLTRLEYFQQWLAQQRASSLHAVWERVRRRDKDLYVKTLFDMVSHERDFVFNARGLDVLAKRYLAPNEPIQYAMLRFAATFAGNTDKILKTYEKTATVSTTTDDLGGDETTKKNKNNGNDDDNNTATIGGNGNNDDDDSNTTDGANNSCYGGGGGGGSNEDDNNDDDDDDYYIGSDKGVTFGQLSTYLFYVKNFYDLISLGVLVPSSILAFADKSNREINAGEACRLMICNPEYDDKFITQMEEMRKIVNLGVGIGLGAYTVPLHGSRETGKISSGFRDFVRSVESCNFLTIHTRLPKVAIYIYADNDTVYETFSLKRPTSESRVDNVFFALMLTKYFIDCVRKDEMWYLFSGQLRDTDPTSRTYNRNLWECRNHEEYLRLRQKFIEKKLYTKRVRATDLMNDIVQSICVSGSPYIIWIDYVNRYNNQRHLGDIRTLNLCAEITNHATHTDSSSCTLMSVNMASFDEYDALLRSIMRQTVYDLRGSAEAFQRGYDETDRILRDELEIRPEVMATMDESRRRLAVYAYSIGYMATVALNNLFGRGRERREIGVTPLGMFDAAFQVLRKRNHADFEDRVTIPDITTLASECLYKGCIVASCDYAFKTNVMCENYINSFFHLGAPQWHLRISDTKVEANKDYRPIKLALHWNKTREHMRYGMANSMLTSQAPTATTSLLTGVCESVTVPLAEKFVRENANGRSVAIPYCLLKAILNGDGGIDFPKYDVKMQLEIYERSAPFVDHSQSTIFMIDIKSKSAVLDLIRRTYASRLKTGIYYIIPRNNSETLTIIRDRKECDACSM